MATITLGAMTLSWILEWDETKVRSVPRYLPLGEEATGETASYTTLPRIIEITCRLTSTEKTTLRDLKDEHGWQSLKEDAVEIDTVWIESIDWSYEGDDCWQAPWKAKIVLVCYDI